MTQKLPLHYPYCILYFTDLMLGRVIGAREGFVGHHLIRSHISGDGERKHSPVGEKGHMWIA